MTVYPSISAHIPRDELIEHFTLHPSDFNLLKRIRQDSTLLGFAVLLKTFMYAGYPPHEKNDIPTTVINRVADQLGLNIARAMNSKLMKVVIRPSHGNLDDVVQIGDRAVAADQ